MFSGLKYIFGYADETGDVASSTATPTDQSGLISSDENNGQHPSASIEKQACMSNSSSGSNLLEQTLNTATTKFTEQLLPPQASIEQLQSSSQHLLPSITEQHEEGRLKEASVLVDSLAKEDEDDDCLEVDSWELLDLVEGSASSNEIKRHHLVSGLESAVPMDKSSSEGYKTTSGILKINKDNKALSTRNDVQQKRSQQQQHQQKTHQKPKVSFETPDLVSKQNEDIEQQQQKQKLNLQNESMRANKSGCKSTKGKKKRNQQKLDVVDFVEQIEVDRRESDTIKEKQEEEKDKEKLSCEQNLSGIGNRSDEYVCSAKITMSTASKLVSDTSVAVSQLTSPQTSEAVTSGRSVMPVLNYAAALSKKTPFEKFLGLAESKKSEKIVVEEVEREKQVGDGQPPGCSISDTGATSSCSNKRNRGPSTSSWSSSSDEIWPESVDRSTNTVMVEGNCFVSDDNESIVSSEFSDCDYGYEGVNDYYVRPKRGGSKRGRNVSIGTSGSLLLNSTMRRGGNERSKSTVGDLKAAALNKMDKPQQRSLEVVKPVRASNAKSVTKTKKKRVGSLVPITSQDYLKKMKRAGVVDLDDDDCEKSRNGSEDKATSTGNELLGAVNGSSNDSSDIAEMDESWYVTPPPCFTGSRRAAAAGVRFADDHQPKTKESARENELIEHPSIPISSKSATVNNNGQRSEKLVFKQSPTKLASGAKSDPVWDRNDYDDDADADVDFDLEEEDWLSTVATTKSKRTIVNQRQQANKQQVDKAQKQVKKSSTTNMKKTKDTSSIETSKQKTTTITKSAGMQSMTEANKSAAWRNKFRVDDWEFDDREDACSDFDNLFEPIKRKKSPSKAKKQQRKHQHEIVVAEAKDSWSPSSDSVVSTRPSADSNANTGAPGLGAELISIRSSCSPLDSSVVGDDVTVVEDDKENLIAKTTITERRPPTQVRPIEPERKPGWQLKRQRSKRKPLSGSISVASASVIKQQANGTRQRQPVDSRKGASSESSSSARSTPTLIDRIGSSIVANINNLTSGLVSSGALHSPIASPLAEEPARANQCAQSAVCQPLATGPFDLSVRKRLSKGFMKRQNICAHKANSQRRPGRQLKMYAKPNGCSINRKVQSNFH